ncbi:hypothetical protein BS17DRAFT_353199 [Gyrodon lividus]|nr:hypothetical protein BS17DRAFT_353199 [Gyrodon lividus]
MLMIRRDHVSSLNKLFMACKVSKQALGSSLVSHSRRQRSMSGSLESDEDLRTASRVKLEASAMCCNCPSSLMRDMSAILINLTWSTTVVSTRCDARAIFDRISAAEALSIAVTVVVAKESDSHSHG